LFEFRFSHKAEKFLKNCEPKIKERIQQALEILRENPLPAKQFDFKKIGGEDETYRIRLSRYRIVYKIFWNENIIRVIKLEKRKDSTYDF
jgi:mRNA interferase RelE/StbE